MSRLSARAAHAAPFCPTCGLPARLVDGFVIYGRSGLGRVWKCQTRTCDTYVGAHPDGRPKGTLANRDTRRARIAAHAAFDRWWKACGLSRGRAYLDLADRMGLDIAHIGEMDVAQCARVVQLYEEQWKRSYGTRPTPTREENTA